MNEEEQMLKEFELIQDVIERQAKNSFRIKGWTVTLVVVAIVFRTGDFELVGAFVPLIGFWWLDAYYLRQEKMYRELYDWVRDKRPESEECKFDLDASRFEDDICTVWETALSPTLRNFYGIIAILLALYTGYVLLWQGVIASG